MATTKDLVQFIMEETPRPEGAVTTTPFRLSTNVLYLPVQEAGLEPGVQFEDRSDEVRGIEGGPPGLIVGYEVAGSINMRAYANALIYLLHIAGWVGTHTAGDGIITDPDGGTIPVGAHRWVFTKRGGNQAKTAQVTQAFADELQFVRGQGMAISGWNLNAAGAFTSTLIGLVYGRISDPNLTPSYDSWSIPHFRRGDISLTWLGSSATTADFTIVGTNPSVRIPTLGSASFFNSLLENDDARVSIAGTIPKATLADADIDALLAGTTFAATAKWVTPKVIGATAYHYSMWLEMPGCQYTGGSLPTMRNVRRFTPTFNWQAFWDETAGYDAKITIIGSVPAVETYV